MCVIIKAGEIMKINEYFKCRNLTCELDNVKGFDFTEFEETEIFEGIKSVLEMKKGKSIL